MAGEHASLRAAIAAASAVTHHWIVRLDELEEAQLSETPGIDAITLLTGADEAAVVASYRTLKQLGVTDEPPSPRIRVAIMGAEPAVAQEAAARLARAATAFLGHQIELTACVPRIGPGRTISVHRSVYVAGSGELPAAIALLRIPGAAAHAAPSSAAPTPGPAPAESPPVSMADPAAQSAVHSEPDRLADLVPGLVPIAARCPYGPEIELATDGTGLLHLLRRTPEGRAGLGELVSAAAWARRHLELLRLTVPASVPALRDEPPVLHIFGEQGTKLRPLLDAPVRIHVLARAQVAGQSVLVSTEVE